jgi:hypothetical protein
MIDSFAKVHLPSCPPFSHALNKSSTNSSAAHTHLEDVEILRDYVKDGNDKLAESILKFMEKQNRTTSDLREKLARMDADRLARGSLLVFLVNQPRLGNGAITKELTTIIRHGFPTWPEVTKDGSLEKLRQRLKSLLRDMQRHLADID